MDAIINKVAESGLITIDLEELYTPGERVLIDIKGWLYEELILKEKEFREYIKQHDWSSYQNKLVAINCSSDAIVPTWAYMLVAIAVAPFANKIVFGSLEQLEEILFEEKIAAMDITSFSDQRIIVKGCSKVNVPVSAYVQITSRLQPIVKSIMYGEPCSTVPLYKRK